MFEGSGLFVEVPLFAICFSGCFEYSADFYCTIDIAPFCFLLGFLTGEARRAKHAAGLFRIYIFIFR